MAMHVRRGDYAHKQHRYNLLDKNYYDKAIHMISGKVSEPTYFFFSDDIKSVKQNISSPAHTVFVSGEQYPDYEELILMSICKHQIIANSTFSGGLHGSTKISDKIIISPRNGLPMLIRKAKTLCRKYGYKYE